MEIFHDNAFLDIFDENHFHHGLIYEDPLINEDAINDIEMGSNDGVIRESMDVDGTDNENAISHNAPAVLNGISQTAPAVFHLENERSPNNYYYRNDSVIINISSDDEAKDESRDEISDDEIVIEMNAQNMTALGAEIMSALGASTQKTATLLNNQLHADLFLTELLVVGNE